MTIDSAIKRAITISRDWNSERPSSAINISQVLDVIPEDDQYQQRIVELLDTIDDHDAILLMNLMYVGREINENESFQACYDRIKHSVKQNKKHAYLKLQEKIPVIDEYICRAIELARANEIQIEQL
ncbi:MULTISPECIES: hypothetical protein [unclassified Providencia]|uniref:hypothetical protein n=1 Tax=unclassified Providencia TaxID=2633465 RepID=UPI00234A2FAF|nr:MULTISPECIES: hypothetical protein [unclassified Providencia]